MGVEVDKRHSTTPPVTNTLFSESGMKTVEGHRKLFGSVLFALLIVRPGIEECALLGVACQAGHAQSHGAEADPSAHALVEQPVDD
jgi:hypothetical protein